MVGHRRVESSSTISVSWLADAPARPRRVALGSFDGIHLGHRSVIAGADTVVTFSPHPRAVVGTAPPLLLDQASKIELLGRLGVAEVVLVPFDRDLAAMSPAAFVDRILVEALAATRVSVGANFRFGRRGLGSVEDLAADRRFETAVEPLLVRDGEVVSSTRIRGLIEAGSLELAGRLLGAPFAVRFSLETQPRRGFVRLTWPSGIVRPAPGTYAATVRGPGPGAEMAAEAVVDEGELCLRSPGRLDPSAAAIVALHRRAPRSTRSPAVHHAPPLVLSPR